MWFRRACSWCGTVTGDHTCPTCQHDAQTDRLSCSCARCRGSGFAREAATANPFRGYSDERLCELAQQYFREASRG